MQKNHKIIRNENLGIKGTHTFMFFKSKSKKFQEIIEEIDSIGKQREAIINENHLFNYRQIVLDSLYERYQSLKRQLMKYKSREFVVHNKIVNNGLNILAARLSGSNLYSGQINYTALGDGSASPVATDSALGNEVYRKAVTAGRFLNNSCIIEVFFNPIEVVGNFEEYGNFIDGSASLNTGVLFNRFTQTVTKSATESLIVVSNITFNSI